VSQSLLSLGYMKVRSGLIWIIAALCGLRSAKKMLKLQKKSRKEPLDTRMLPALRNLPDSERLKARNISALH